LHPLTNAQAWIDNDLKIIGSNAPDDTANMVTKGTPIGNGQGCVDAPPYSANNPAVYGARFDSVANHELCHTPVEHGLVLVLEQMNLHSAMLLDRIRTGGEASMLDATADWGLRHSIGSHTYCG
jgi:hypothetical protein